jgi:hypothetical protein
MIARGGPEPGEAGGRIRLLDGDEDLEYCRDAALARCDEMIAWYRGKRRRANAAFNLLQGIVIVLTATAPVLVLSDALADAALRALPATVVAIAVALLASYKLRESWVRYTVAAEALRSEKAKYLTRTTPAYWRLPPDEALNNFVLRVEGLALSEVEEWRKQMAQPPEGPQAGPRAAA